MPWLPIGLLLLCCCYSIPCGKSIRLSARVRVVGTQSKKWWRCVRDQGSSSPSRWMAEGSPFALLEWKVECIWMPIWHGS
ncbi:hypothetical protein M440DRAFT_1396680 [Trichoderma longibrachiatum ATCC 18648]|uniref:Secreted protein n=1 Tax=Trichoderma longibrachiatum ATCC 18648 TaxID=983965 RepID=A0A2T4CJ30_TRILO|nr:hypothetical protein M440DRAFT_1396680 [Trichoderma longibrachiatum ATCC 18648]